MRDGTFGLICAHSGSAVRRMTWNSRQRKIQGSTFYHRRGPLLAYPWIAVALTGDRHRADSGLRLKPSLRRISIQPRLSHPYDPMSRPQAISEMSASPAVRCATVSSSFRSPTPRPKCRCRTIWTFGTPSAISPDANEVAKCDLATSLSDQMSVPADPGCKLNCAARCIPDRMQ